MLSIAAITSLVVAQVPGPTVLINTTHGVLRGNKLQHTNEFLGFPFATAARFEAPKIWEQHLGTASQPFDATYFGPACLQTLTSNTTYGKEDCFVMNVWQPQRKAAEATELLPVLLWVYGGENDFGEAEPYNASTLASNHDVIVCSFNYRVGPFGFLAFEEEIKAGRSSGNYALQDIQMAMKWVQKNVHQFGGDKTQVSLFGQSSGAGNVEIQTVIPSNAGLFRGAISESGGLGADALADALNNTATVAKRVNCTQRGFTKDKTLECLRATKAEDIIFSQRAVCKTPNDCHGLSFGPVTDGILVPADPMQLLKDGKVVPGVSILYGAQTNDSNFGVQGDYMNESGYPEYMNRSRYTGILADYLGVTARSSQLHHALELYPPTSTSQGNIDRIGWYKSDKFLCSIRRNVKLYAKAATKQQQDNNGDSDHFSTDTDADSEADKTRQFMYRFNYWFQSNKTCTAESNYHGPALGATHQMRLPSYSDRFSNCSQRGWSGFDPTCLGCEFDKKEAAFAFDVGRYWSNFASSGNPNVRAKSSQTLQIKRHNNSKNTSHTGRASKQPRHVRNTAVEWPDSATTDMSIVLEPRIHVEDAVGRKDACKFWDSVAE